MSPRLFIIITYFSLGIGISFLVWTLEPYKGDLTRIGGYTENDHGWNDPQQSFPESEVIDATGLDDYNKPFDILILGDSFSNIHKGGPYDSWQEHLIRSTGMSLIRFHLARLNPTDLIKHPQFLEHPPKLIIFQIVERGLQGALHHLTQPIESPSQKSFQAVDFKLIEGHSKDMIRWPRDTSPSQSFNTAAHFLKTKFKHLTSSRRKTLSFSLTKACFSSTKNSTLLTFFGDLDRNPLTEGSWKKISARFENLSDLLGAHAPFALMIAPDKSSVYTPWIESDHSFTSGIDRLTLSGVKTINLLEPLRKGVEEGLLDIYLPNDSHWGSMGHKIAADTILEEVFKASD